VRDPPPAAVTPPRHVAVALPVPVFERFTYALPDGADAPPGVRVHVDFGPRALVGVVLPDAPEPFEGAVRPVRAVLDRDPVLTPEHLAFLRWAAGYYHHPLGEVLHHALPVALRGPEAPPRQDRGWSLSDAGADRSAGGTPGATGLERAPRQREALAVLAAWLREHEATVAPRSVLSPRFAHGVLAGLERRGHLQRVPLPGAVLPGRGEPSPHAPTEEQAAALEGLREAPDTFRPALLEGVTGSGKTEVYLRLMADTLARGRQCLLLVPEIGLTPQLVRRVTRRLEGPVALLHSGLSPRQRLDAWRAAGDGTARTVLGTRSAVLAPLPELGLVIVDEEHDPSYKQQDGFRYSARDLAVKRARDAGCAVVLGSATPSLETLAHARAGRYDHRPLTRRAGPHAAPAFRFVDLRRHPAPSGLAEPVVAAMRERLDAGEQCLVFLNRRGFAPVLACQACGWTADCERCSARYTLHRQPPRLLCHHCDRPRPVPPTCPACGSDRLGPVGFGTQRLTTLLAERFGAQRLLRLDRDSAAGAGLAEGLDRLRSGEPCVVVGTQMLAKGHDFPRLTLVAVANADAGLLSVDFRGVERAAQTLTQVAGRAGRAERPGEVWLQTLRPDDPALLVLARDGYGALARDLLHEREEAGWPPYAHLALLRAEAPEPAPAEERLAAIAGRLGPTARAAGVELLGPVPAPMERRQGRHRMQLLLRAPVRAALHRVLRDVEPELGRRARARVTLDVDPQDTY
jgi:primosomal protein N' (replication factor Y)